MVLAGTILGHAAINDDKWVAGSNSYGAQARGGAAGSEVIIAKNPIIYPHVINVDILIVMSQTAYDQYIEDLAEQDALVLYDDMIVHSRDIPGVQQIGVPATKRAIDEFDNKQVANIVMLGAAAGMTKIVTKKSLMLVIQAQVGHRFREVNKKALHAGFTLAKTRNPINPRNQTNQNGS